VCVCVCVCTRMFCGRCMNQCESFPAFSRHDSLIYMHRMSKNKKVCHQYSTGYILFGFIPAPHDERLPLCLVCRATFSNEAMTPKVILKIFTAQSQAVDDNVLTSFNMSLLIAKAGKSHDIGDRLIVPCIKQYLSTVLKKSATMVSRGLDWIPRQILLYTTNTRREFRKVFLLLPCICSRCL
jgi:hypothetical protein